MPIFMVNCDNRHTIRILLMSFLAVVICYLDRVSISVAIVPMAAEFDWNYETQGRILSAFFIGYMLLQIVGGRLAERCGGRIVLAAGILFLSLFVLATPLAAYWGVGVLILARIAMGLSQAVALPSIYASFGRNVPLQDRAKALGFTHSGVAVGTIAALILTPIVIQRLEWSAVFYLYGAAGLVWIAIWRISARNDRQAALEATPTEQSVTQQRMKYRNSAAPWKPLLASRAVWAIIIAHFCGNWSVYTFISWLPTYFNDGLGVDFAVIGIAAAIPFVTSFVFLNIGGVLADRLVASGKPVLQVRKLAQSISLGGLALALFLVSFVDTVWIAVALMSLATALKGFSAGGVAPNHMDIAPNHSGTLFGISNTIGTLPGVIGIYISGLILEFTGSWTLVFQVAATFALIGLVFYVLLARAEPVVE
ncbi:MAG: ACS family MFS transporter [Pseudomonadota bacterium]